MKSNIGHLEATSALAGIVKTILALEHSQIPPQMHFNTPNPKIDFSHLTIAKHSLDWPKGLTRVRLAAVNSFGAGGTNGHVVLQGYSCNQSDTYSGDQQPLLYRLSANTDKALGEMRTRLAKYIEQKRPKLQDLAYTLLNRRSAMSRTTYIVAETMEGLLESLLTPSPTVLRVSTRKNVPVVLVFTGQGAQWYVWLFYPQNPGLTFASR